MSEDWLVRNRIVSLSVLWVLVERGMSSEAEVIEVDLCDEDGPLPSPSSFEFTDPHLSGELPTPLQQTQRVSFTFSRTGRGSEKG